MRGHITASEAAKGSVVSHLESGARVAVVPVPGAHAGLALHEVGDHLKLLERESIDKIKKNNQKADG